MLHETALQDFGRSDKTIKRSNNGFNDLGITPNLIKEVKRLKFTDPTPIQREAIPVGIQGDDIIAIAQTGSGKTLAFGIPMLQRLSKMKRGGGLVLVPTRELALQVDEALKDIGRSMNMRSAVLIGGASMSLQREALKKNPRIIIATPGRLMDHIERRTVDLSRTAVFVLDEADRMLDMGFVPAVRKIIKSIPDKRQTMLFSATMPKEIESIARQLMEDPIHIESDRSGATPAEVSHEMFLIENQAKSRLLAVQLKQCSGPVLVFTRTKRMASRLTIKVNNMGFAAAEIHSNRSLGQRRSALEGFKRGRYQILIATDIAARGIDVSGIELVVNYDMPANSEDYVHRIGRTGRAGRTGHAISFATTDQRGTIRDIERFMRTKMAISALPTLPSERRLLSKVDRLNVEKAPPGDEKPSRRGFSTGSSPDGRAFKKSGSREFAPTRDDSRRKDSKGAGSARGSQEADFGRNDSKSDTPFWARFKNKRTARKKSVGQGSRRKKRAKRK